MSSQMTLREAVEIVDCGRFDYCHPRGPDWDSDESRGARWDRARAIVDAAVEAHERLNEGKRMDWAAAVHKIRALERGEDPKP